MIRFKKWILIESFERDKNTLHLIEISIRSLCNPENCKREVFLKDPLTRIFSVALKGSWDPANWANSGSAAVHTQREAACLSPYILSTLIFLLWLGCFNVFYSPMSWASWMKRRGRCAMKEEKTRGWRGEKERRLRERGGDREGESTATSLLARSREKEEDARNFVEGERIV